MGWQQALRFVLDSAPFSGDLGALYPGVDVTDTRSAHDTRWASGGSPLNRGEASIHRHFRLAPTSPGSAQRNECEGFAGLYQWIAADR